MEVNHTFLLNEGTWNVKGYFFDENEKSFNALGETIIEHEIDSWKISGSVKLSGSDDLEIVNIYSVIPFNGKVTTWSSENPKLGKLKGSFLINEEYIISMFESEDKKYSGSEYLVYINDNLYRNRGVIFEGKKKFTSWTVELKNINESKT